jgi:hypothetical protein
MIEPETGRSANGQIQTFGIGHFRCWPERIASCPTVQNASPQFAKDHESSNIMWGELWGGDGADR